jgi:DNA-binding response OmpR family regulator
MAQKKWFAPIEEKTHDIGELDLPKKCLVLDDDEDFVRVMTDFLLSQNWQVHTAKSGVEGLKKIMADDFDLVICDMVMPNLPGDMFYLAVERTRPRLCRRFIFMTGHRGDPKIDAFIRRVGGLMLWKPFQMHELQMAIQSVLRKAARMEESEQTN